MCASQERGELGKSVVYAMPRTIRVHNESHVVIPEHIRHLAPKLSWNRQTGEDQVVKGKLQKVFRDQVRAYLDDLTNELRSRATSDTTVFFVEETLSRRPNPGDLTSELLTRFDSVDYVFVARAQQYIVSSAIGQRLKGGAHPSSWDARVSTFLSNENLAHQFDYASIIDRWGSSEPRVRSIVVPFLESDRGTQKLFERILKSVDVSANLGKPLKRSGNFMASRFEISAIGFYKKVAFRFSQKRIQRGLRRFSLFGVFRLAIALVARLIRSPRWEILPDERIVIIDHYRESNLRFRKKLGDLAESVEWTEWFQRGNLINR